MIYSVKVYKRCPTAHTQSIFSVHTAIQLAMKVKKAMITFIPMYYILLFSRNTFRD